MLKFRILQQALLGTTALAFAGAQAPDAASTGPALQATASFISGTASSTAMAEPARTAKPSSSIAMATKSALDAFTGVVRPLSHPEALEDAFKSYFAFKSAHPEKVQKPLLYFVDYGLAATEKRGYVFDMQSLKVIDGPFTVAHGRGSSTTQYGVPTIFQNGSGSNSTSLGLYVASSLYGFTGHMAGSTYNSTGMRLVGVSTGFNDKAFARGVVAHGAPYVTATKAGRSQGCPAMETDRAARLLPKLANGGMVFLFAPNQNWMQNDPWVNANAS
jgi:hypothetical protein